MATRICFVTKELFAWGKYGGFGKYVRLVSRELIKRGFEVCAVIPRSENQASLEDLDGVIVFGLPYPTSLLDSVPSELVARTCASYLYSKCRADIYHSVNPSFYTLLAKLGRPSAKHLIAFSDLRDMHDWRRIATISSEAAVHNKIRGLPVESQFLKRVVKQADGFYAKADFLAEKAVKMYGLDSRPPIVRHPIEAPRRNMKKSDQPVVCFLGRLDPVKRPWVYFELARKFPQTQFCVMGQTTVPSKYAPLIKAFSSLSNLKFLGWTFGERKSRILEKSWILINTSIHEALPVAFLEAWSHECAVLSGANPDGLVNKYGCYVPDGDFARGLQHLIGNNLWEKKGKAGRQYVETHHDVRSNIERLIEIYHTILTEP